ncbi:MAG TPA: hypothetical protein VKY45_04555, partial [Marinilabiliaceae bacterium]|nr:hypothetical protein [Marinilabiliaceae bacterium]
MKYGILLYMFGCLLLVTSCAIDSRKREIRNSLNREVEFNMFNCVSQNRKSVLLEDVWSEYDFLSVVYRGCNLNSVQNLKITNFGPHDTLRKGRPEYRAMRDLALSQLLSGKSLTSNGGVFAPIIKEFL